MYNFESNKVRYPPFLVKKDTTKWHNKQAKLSLSSSKRKTKKADQFDNVKRKRKEEKMTN